MAGKLAPPAARPRVLAPAEARALAAEAIARFLDAVLPPAERAAPDLAATPDRVAEAWCDELLDGYGQDPAALLAEAIPSRARDLVAVTGIEYHSMCPHHLLPSRGLAHVGYLPGGRVIGFGQLARLVDCFAHRLVLEEDVAQLVAQALVDHLGARGAACVLEAEQTCLSTRGELQPRARAHAECFVGALASEAALQRRFLDAIARRGPRAARAGAPRAPSRAAVRRAR